MIEKRDSVEIPLGKSVDSPKLGLCTANAKKIFVIGENDLNARYQLEEQGEYEYKFSNPGFHFLIEDATEGGTSADAAFGGILNPSNIQGNRRRAQSGIIKTRNYVGHCTLPYAYNGEPRGNVEIEIRSVKIDYEEEYRQMLEDITKEYTDIVMIQGSPVSGRFQIDRDTDSKTLYQQFCFLKSAIESDTFRAAIYKIQANPIKRWEHVSEERSILNIRRLGRSEMKQIASRPNRFPTRGLNANLPAALTSLPSRITVTSKTDTLDNQENRFVKYALTHFLVFCKELQSMKAAGTQLKRECAHTANLLESFLRLSVFKNVSNPKTLEFNSPALTRKEGYREVFETWVLFSLAALFGWDGGNNVYEAGKRNVACLYEYWLFFQLRKIFIDIFKCTGHGELVSFGEDRINLNLKQGRQLKISGVFNHRFGHRHLNGALYYNRTFSHRDNMKVAGSWTEQMRPDYTLSIWPGEGVSEATAERNDTIVHIHFDAKYKVDNFRRPTEVDEATESTILDQRKRDEENGKYKQADLLKMHAYKDAIRRTSGAYIIYPGDDPTELKAFHEIIPGLGAFCMKPTRAENGSKSIRDFVVKLIMHHLDRLSQREKMSKYQHNIFSHKNTIRLRASIPDHIIADETYVLVGYYESVNKDFINKHGYNTRINERDGSIDISHDLLMTKYALLYNEDTTDSPVFKKIKQGALHVYTKSYWIEKGYIASERDNSDGYLVFPLDDLDDIEKEFSDIKWHPERIRRYMNYLDFRRKPAPVLLSDLLLANNRLTDD